MDLATVKAAANQDLVACAVAAAANAQSVVDDAELLALADRRARACFLAELAVEEVGKALSLMALSLLPEKLKGQAPVRRMLEWHELKLVGGLLIALTPPGETPARRLAGMSADELAQIMDKSKVLAMDESRLKQRGLYVDMDSRGCITQPADVTEAEVSDQLTHARQAVSSARALLDPRAPARLATPPAEAFELAHALASALTKAASTRTPEAAADAMFKAVTRLREQQAAENEREP
jgi:AbiV family abortive infection protein